MNEGDVGRPLWVSISEMMILYDIDLETHKGPPYIFNDTALKRNKLSIIINAQQVILNSF